MSGEWFKRPFRDDDAEPLRYMLGVSYTRSRAGIRAGASGAGKGRDEHGKPKPPTVEEAARHRAFLEAHRPIWDWLFRHADITLTVDPEDPDIIFAWLITTGDVVHAVGCKRSFTEREGLAPGELPVSVDLVADILGERLNKHQVCSLELPQMRTRGNGNIGLDRPQEWSLDPTWLTVRMGSR